MKDGYVANEKKTQLQNFDDTAMRGKTRRACSVLDEDRSVPMPSAESPKDT